MANTSIVVEITIPAEQFELGQIFSDFSDATVRFERVVPLHSEPLSLLWVSNGSQAPIEAALKDHPQTGRVRSLTKVDGEQLFEVHWRSELNGLIQTMIETNARLLKAEGTAEEWELRLRFGTHEDLTAFNEAVTDQGTSLLLRQLHDLDSLTDQATLSAKQREAITQAYRDGYFNVPRDSTITDLATDAGISDSAFSQRLRRGLCTLVRETLISTETDLKNDGNENDHRNL